ncbi:MAG: cytosolic protein [Coleofasciculaceae cyanobacterium SM2_1_6]|nr:cytosolic protein [Coleofasciculaceae cyanobacterium SM2_1_6]
MNNYQYDDYYNYLATEVISPFYAKRLEKLHSLKLKDVLRRKNPYLFKAKNFELAGDLIKSIVDAFLSSHEETIFGNLLEGFAVYVSQKLYGGIKSKFKSIDLEFEREGLYYIVGIKSGIHWGNSDQIATMQNNFKMAKSQLRQQGISGKIEAVNGCIYGKEKTPLKTNLDPEENYYKYAGQDFWHFISGDDHLYREIIKPIDQEVRQKDETFKKAYSSKINEMTQEFMKDFMTMIIK